MRGRSNCESMNKNLNSGKRVLGPGAPSAWRKKIKITKMDSCHKKDSLKASRNEVGVSSLCRHRDGGKALQKKKRN